MYCSEFRSVLGYFFVGGGLGKGSGSDRGIGISLVVFLCGVLGGYYGY